MHGWKGKLARTEVREENKKRARERLTGRAPYHVFGVRDVEQRCVKPGLSQFEAGRSRFFFFVVIRALFLIIIALRSVITGSCFSTGGGLFVLIIVVGVLLAVVFVVIVVLGGHRGLEGHRLLL